MNPAFSNTQAVEAWDMWFRWRERGQLRDLTIAATWERVVGCLTANTSGAGRAEYSRRLADAFTAWSLLLDERIVATAGTANPSWPCSDLVAVLNLATFVRSPGQARASFDSMSIEDAAALAVYALDDAALRSPAAQSADNSTATEAPVPRLRIGFVGFADALALLGVSYDSEEGRRHARQIAQSLANGCLAGSIALARDRGPRVSCDEHWRNTSLERQYPLELVDCAMRYGLRYAALTAITSQRRLATLANNASDAIDSSPIDASPQSSGNIVSRRVAANAGGAQDIEPGRPGTSVPAQLRMRSAMQPWIDERICYPATLTGQPDVAALNDWNQLAEKLDLAPLTLRR